jgi:hypothetical protein
MTIMKVLLKQGNMRQYGKSVSKERGKKQLTYTYILLTKKLDVWRVPMTKIKNLRQKNPSHVNYLERKYPF